MEGGASPVGRARPGRTSRHFLADQKPAFCLGGTNASLPKETQGVTLLVCYPLCSGLGRALPLSSRTLGGSSGKDRGALLGRSPGRQPVVPWGRNYLVPSRSSTFYIPAEYRQLVYFFKNEVPISWRALPGSTSAPGVVVVHTGTSSLLPSTPSPGLQWTC